MADGQEHNFGVEEILALLAQITGGGGLDNTKDLLDIQKVLYNLGMPLEDLVGIVLPEKPGDAPSYTPYVSDLQKSFPEGSSMYGAMNDIANGESAGETLAKMQELYKTQPEKFADLFMAEGYDGQPGNTPDWSWVRDTLEEFAVDNAKGVRENAAGEAELSAYQQQVDDYERSLRPTTGLSEFGDPTLEDFHGAFGGDKADALVQRLADQRREIEAAKAARAAPSGPSAAARSPRLAGPPGPGFRPEGPVPDVSGGLQGAPGAPGLLQSRTPATMGFGRSQPFPQGGGGIPQGGGGIPTPTVGIPQTDGGIPSVPGTGDGFPATIPGAGPVAPVAPAATGVAPAVDVGSDTGRRLIPAYEYPVAEQTMQQLIAQERARQKALFDAPGRAMRTPGRGRAKAWLEAGGSNGEAVLPEGVAKADLNLAGVKLRESDILRARKGRGRVTTTDAPNMVGFEAYRKELARLNTGKYNELKRKVGPSPVEAKRQQVLELLATVAASLGKG